MAVDLFDEKLKLAHSAGNRLCGQHTDQGPCGSDLRNWAAPIETGRHKPNFLALILPMPKGRGFSGSPLV
jgi:hypothetical protein